MSEIDDKVKKAVASYKAGRKSEARELLMEIVDADDKNEQGWLYLSLVVDSKQEQQICLENVLAINPNNKQARKALEVLNKKLGAPPPPPPPTTPSAAPVVSSFASPAVDDTNTISSWGDIDTSASGLGEGWDDAPAMPATPAPPPAPAATPTPPAPPAADNNTGWFDDMDSPWQADANDPALSGDVGFGASPQATPPAPTPPPAPAQPASNTSVEWSNPKTDDGYTYGRTGATGQEFASDELDSWISDMGIGVGGSAFDQLDQQPKNPDPFGGSPVSSPPASPAPEPGGASGGFDDFDWGSVAFNKDDKSEEMGDFGSWDEPSPAAPSATATPAPAATDGGLGAGWSDIGTDASPFGGDLFQDVADTPASPPAAPAAETSFAAPATPSTSLYDDDDDDDDDADSGTIFPSYDPIGIYDDDEEEQSSLTDILGESTDLTDIDGIDESGKVRIPDESLEFFAQIPEDIKAAKQSGGVSVVAILVLLLLNVGAAAAAYMQFSSM